MNIKKDQVYADKDIRRKGRKFRITKVNANGGVVIAENLKTKKSSEISIARIGRYQLVK